MDEKKKKEPGKVRMETGSMPYILVVAGFIVGLLAAYVALPYITTAGTASPLCGTELPAGTFVFDQEKTEELGQALADSFYLQDGLEHDVSYSSYEESQYYVALHYSIDGQDMPLYITKDYEYIITGVSERELTIQQISLAKEDAETQFQAQQDVEVSADDDPVKGSENATVTIIEFSDFECPFCARFYEQTLPQIEENYINTGKVKLVYRDYPLGFHQNAQKAAEAAECADEQGKFWEMHDMIFENQNAIDTASLKQYAGQLGLNTSEFNDCLDSGRMASEVQKDFSDGSLYGVTGTPAFFINGVLVSGAQPYSVFEQVIEEQLAAS